MYHAPSTPRSEARRSDPAMASFEGAPVEEHAGGPVRAVRGRADGDPLATLYVEIGRRIRDVHVHDGSIWVLTEHEDGEVLRLTPRSR
jgi:glucose/arabinose dehydrogenase